ncbi:MAG: dockerin type I domain-containing protein [Phycisphaerales bacterium]|nr:dockerin type I domain-containing protein [Phycisphaerales bacterium]
MPFRTAIAIIASLSCVHATHGGIFVGDEHGLPVSSEHWSLSTSPEGYTLILHGLHSPWQETWYVIDADGNEQFNEIRIEVDGPAAGSPVFIRVQGASTMGCITQTGNAETRLDLIEVSGTVGHIQADSIGTIMAGHDVAGPIIATTGPNPTRGIEHVQAAGMIRGDVLAVDGAIGTLVATQLGTSSAPIAIRSRHGVDSIVVEGDAHMDLHLRTAEGTGTLGCLDADAVHGTLAIDGFHSESAIHLSGPLHADLTIGSGLVGINPIVELPLHGLQGAIIVNVDDVDAIWTAPVRFGEDGSDMLVYGPTYDQLPSEVGGGSIGVVPFRMHASACTPESGQSAGPDLSPVLRWYGPVTWTTGTPLVIQHRAADTEPWQNVEEGAFYCTSVIGDATAIRIESTHGSGFEAGHSYRAIPSASLRCAVGQLPAVSVSDVWQIEIEDDACIGDLDGDAYVAVGDLLVLIACWGEVDDPLSSTADLNGDGAVGVIDLLLLIGSWGECV